MTDKAASPVRWDDTTYRQFDTLQEAINDFTSAMHPRLIRESARPSYVIEQWDTLGEAVGLFWDHLYDLANPESTEETPS